MRKLLGLMSFGLALMTGLSSPVLARTPERQSATQIEATRLELTATDGRVIETTVWRAPDERAVIVFSHGWNSEPASYTRIIDAWVRRGFTVVAPLHVDSLRHPRHAEGDNMRVFATRIEDLAVARGYVAASHPEMPIIAAGHSFGSLNALIQAGAMTVAGPHSDPAVRAVIAISSPGNVPGLVDAGAFASVAGPVLVIAGDADLVPGFVADPRDHRASFDASTVSDKMMLTFAGGDHSLIRNADDSDFDVIVQATSDFVLAHVLDDPAARTRLDRLVSSRGVTVERR